MYLRRNRLGVIAAATAGIGYLLFRNRAALRFQIGAPSYNQVRDFMTRDARCCTRETPLVDVARMMVEGNCGEIPVVDSFTHLRPIGVVTDRDIVCRVLARGRNPIDLHAEACMSTPAITIHQHAPIEECIRLMEENRIRRIPVLDRQGRICGIVSQVDLARILGVREAGEWVERVSRPGYVSPHVAA